VRNLFSITRYNDSRYLHSFPTRRSSDLNMKHKSLVIIMLCITSWVFAQEDPSSFTLQEAIDFALENNRQAKNAVRNIEAAKKQKWETTATGLPQINGAIDYQNWLKQQVSLLPAEIAGGEPGTFVPVTFSPKQSL